MIRCVDYSRKKRGGGTVTTIMSTDAISDAEAAPSPKLKNVQHVKGGLSAADKENQSASSNKISNKRSNTNTYVNTS